MADLLVLAPWLVFGAGLGAIGVRLLGRSGTSQRGTARRRPRHPVTAPTTALSRHAGSWKLGSPARAAAGRPAGRQVSGGGGDGSGGGGRT